MAIHVSLFPITLFLSRSASFLKPFLRTLSSISPPCILSPQWYPTAQHQGSWLGHIWRLVDPACPSHKAWHGAVAFSLFSLSIEISGDSVMVPLAPDSLLVDCAPLSENKKSWGGASVSSAQSDPEGTEMPCFL